MTRLLPFHAGYPMLTLPLAASFAVSIAAAAAPASQTADLVELALHETQTVHVAGGSYAIFDLDSFGYGADGGWVVRAFLSPLPPTTDFRWAVFGERAGQVGAGVELLRTTGLVAGVNQAQISNPAMGNGQVGYLARRSCCFVDTVWRDDTLIAELGDPVGSSSGVWSRFEGLSMTSSGAALIRGEIQDSLGFSDALVNHSTGDTLLRENMAVPGLPGFVETIELVDVSPGGEHWIARVRMNTMRTAILMDGDVLTFGDGHRAFEGDAVPPNVEAKVGPADWLGFDNVFVNDRGDYLVEGVVPGAKVAVRNDFVVMDGFGSDFLYRAIDERGIGLWAPSSGPRVLAESGLTVEFNPGVDADGDGVADPEWSLLSLPVIFPGANSGEPTVFRATLGGQHSLETAVLRGRPYRLGTSYCDGVPNSTGHPADMFVSGDARAFSNEVRFHALGLPRASLGYFLVSLTPGLTVQAGGSAGTLCLDGSIGRLSSQVFSAGTTGTAAAAVDITALPGPVGSVAVMAGDVWHSQAWYRDTSMGTPTSNFSSASRTVFD